MKIDWKRKLTSRKLWIAAAGFVAGLIAAFGGSSETAETVSGCILSGKCKNKVKERSCNNNCHSCP